MNAIGWLLTYALPVAISAFGTASQGDDGPWSFSLFFLAPISAFGAVILVSRRASLREFSRLGLIHICTAILAVSILPSYWDRATIRGEHITAGLDPSPAVTFEPAAWHVWWAPVMTILTVIVVLLAAYALTRKASN